MRGIVLLVACSLLALISAQDDYFSMEKKNPKKHYCGNELRITLMFLCDSVYKRSSQEGTTSDWIMNYLESEEPQQPQYFPFRSRNKALSTMAGYFRRQTRGVADECCSKPCSISELQSYCGRPVKV